MCAGPGREAFGYFWSWQTAKEKCVSVLFMGRRFCYNEDEQTEYDCFMYRHPADNGFAGVAF